jgi:transcription elongation GreA/GreB family factor
LPLDADLLQMIKKKNHEAVEAAWSARIDAAPRDLAWFEAVVREVAAAKGHAKVIELTDLLADGLASEDAWEEAFDAIGLAIQLVPRNKEIRVKAVEMFSTRYADRTDLDECLEFFGLADSDDPVRTYEALREWLRYGVGAGVYLFGRGLGKVAEVNLALQKIKIRFEKTAPLVVKRDEAKQLLTWIPEDHFMMRRLADPEGVAAEAKSDPGAILRELLTSFDRPLTSAEIRECMTGVVEGAKWSSWWNRAKSHPQVLPSKHKRNAFEWSESSEDAEKSLLGEFEQASLETRLELARSYAKRGGAVRDGAMAILRSELEERAGTDSSEVVEIAHVLEEFGALPEPSPLDLDELLRSPRASEIIVGVRDRRYREKLYSRTKRVRGEDWPGVLRDAFFAERDFRLMNRLYEELLEHGPDGDAERLVVESVSTPRKSPRPFVWAAKAVLRRDELSSRANHSLLSKVIEALDSPEFKDLKAPLREHFEPGGLAFAVFERSSRDGVDHLLNLIDSAAGLEDHRKTAIRRAIFRKYPHIRKRVDEDVVYVSAESAEAKRKEFEDLVKVQIPENAEAIRVAREYGDLRENFEYHAARQKHELLNSRAAQLHDELRKIRLIDPEAVDASKVSIGTVVEMRPTGGGESRSVTILGPWDSDVESDVYSYQSEFAKGLLGRRPGETVEMDGEITEITAIRPWKSASEAVPE